MSVSAAEKICIDDGVLANQQQRLAAQGETFSKTAAPAAAQLAPGTFGAMNIFLVEAMNELAASTGELASAAAALSCGMAEGVGRARATFAQLEDAAVATFSDVEFN